MLNLFLRARNRKKKGFTIIELVIVIAIIGVLSAVLVPNFSNTLLKADSTAKAANLASVNKIAASTQTASGIGNMLEVYSAVVSNFGEESTAKALRETAFNSETRTFTALKKVVEETPENPAKDTYYPVYGETSSEIAASLLGYDFVQYKAGKTNLSTQLTKISKYDNTDYSAANGGTYVISGSIALYDNVSMPNTMFVFVNGASLEMNGYSFDCHSCFFVDTKGTDEVTFKVYGGTLAPHYNYGAFTVNVDFVSYVDGKLSVNWDAQPAVVKEGKVTLYQGGFLTPLPDKKASVYLNVAKASAHVEGTIVLTENTALTLDGESHFVVEDGGTILPAQTQGDTSLASDVSVVLTSAEGSETTVELKDGSFVGITLAGAGTTVNGEAMQAGDQKFTVSPLTAQVAANRITQCAQAMLTAGGNTEVVLSVVEKVGNAMVGTASALSVGGGGVNATASTLSADAVASVNSLVNNFKTAVVDTAVNCASAGNAVNSTVSGAIGTVTVTTVSAGKISGSTAAVSQISSYTSCDTSWYTNNPAGPWNLTTPAQVYGLSTLVYNGTDTFYGKVINLGADIDLSAYTPWLPIGNGQYGFRGTFNGAKAGGGTYKISGMKLDVNETWALQNLQFKGWNSSYFRTKTEGTAFGYQNGDKYGIGFFGVIENGATVKDITFSNCVVNFNYNWNSYAAVAVGAIRATGEDYSDNAGNQPAAGLDAAKYNATGGRWAGSNLTEQQTTRLSMTAGQTVGTGSYLLSSTDYADRAYTGWTTTVSGVTVDSTCSVTATGRCGGVIAVMAGAYYSTTSYNEGKVSSGADKSVFAGWGTVNISDCINAAAVTQVPTGAAYEEAGGILGYTQVSENVSMNISHCTNTGHIKAACAAGIVGSLNKDPKLANKSITDCTSDIAKIEKISGSVHTSTSISAIYNLTTSKAGE